MAEVQDERGLRRCPWCAEWIQPAAKICRYCQREVVAVSETVGAKSAQPPVAATIQGAAPASRSSRPADRSSLLGPLEGEPRTPAPTAPVADPALANLRGAEGWLALFGLGCFLSPIGLLVSALGDWNMPSTTAGWSVVVSRMPVLPFLRGFEMGGQAILAVGFLVLGVSLVRLRPATGYLAVTVLSCAFAFWVGDLLLLFVIQSEASQLSGNAIATSDTVESYAGLVRNSLWSLLWLSYFFRSKRAKANFGQTTWRDVGRWLRGQLPTDADSLHRPA